MRKVHDERYSVLNYFQDAIVVSTGWVGNDSKRKTGLFWEQKMLNADTDNSQVLVVQTAK